MSVSADKTFCLREMKGQKLVCRFEGHEDIITSVAVTVEGKCPVSGACDDTVHIWDLSLEGDRGVMFLRHSDSAGQVGVSDSGERVVSVLQLEVRKH